MLTTGDIVIRPPLKWPGTNNATAQIGGTSDGRKASPLLSITGVFPTGLSSVPGGSEYYRYAKVFFVVSGTASDTLVNPCVYIANPSVSDQVAMAPDPYWIKNRESAIAAQTGVAANITSKPDHVLAAEFSGYTFETPMNLSSLSGSSITLSQNSIVGVWLRLKISPGLPANPEASFNLGLKGEIP